MYADHLVAIFRFIWRYICGFRFGQPPPPPKKKQSLIMVRLVPVCLFCPIFITHVHLQAYDQHLNMVLGDVEETVTTVELDDETLEEMIKVGYTCFHFL